MDEKIYDLIVIGGGPAGLTAGIYAGRAMLDVLVIEKDRAGGQINLTNEIVNYPGIIETCLLYTSPSPRDGLLSRMPSSA